MPETTITALDSISKSIDALRLTVEARAAAFWDTQWFAALVGAVTALLVTFLKEFIERRKRSLKKIYEALLEHRTSFRPDFLLETAQSTLYGHTQYKDGKTTVIPEKSLAEKIVIQLRRLCKYWTFPLSRIRWLFGRYENAIINLPNIKGKDVKQTNEFQIVEKIYSEIIENLEKKTGENEWTVR